ncbi:unnamed protein product [Cunninghamella echinulata]
MGATDSKLAFRKSVFRLFEERSISWDAEILVTVLDVTRIVNNVYSLVGSNDIRRARDSAPENIETLIDKLLYQMDKIIHEPSFPSPQYSTQHLLNCCRVLSRIIPYLYEQGSEEWELQFWWTNYQRKIHDQESKKETSTTRGDLLLSLTLQCLFLSGFTLPSTLKNLSSTPTETSNYSMIHTNYVIWETGIGSSTPIGSTRENESHRIEILRLLLAILSKSMYIPVQHYLRQEDKWLQRAVKITEKRIVLALLCSLMNTICNYNPSTWGKMIHQTTDITLMNREYLVTLCLRVLLLLLDTHSPTSLLHLTDQPLDNHLHQQLPDYTTIEKEWELADDENKYIYYISKLHRAQDFQFLIDGLYRTLSHPMQGISTYLPNSKKSSNCHFEMVMLSWKLIQINKRFRTYLMETERALDLMLVLIYHAMDNKLESSQLGIVRMCAFVLQTLSTDRRFGTILNKPFNDNMSLPTSIRIASFHGTYADFLILSIFNLIATSKGNLSTLYPTFVLTITNASPYFKNLSLAASNKLITLFGSFSAPGFLLADENNPSLVKYILEAFNNLLHYQFSDNGMFVYSIIRNHVKFERLRDFDLDQILMEQKMKQISITNNSNSHTSSSTASLKIDNENKEENEDATPPLSEKALGKRPGLQQKRQMSVSSMDSTGSSSTTVNLSIANTGFIPTHEWLDQWKNQWSLDTCLNMIDQTLPSVQKVGERQALDMLRTMDFKSSATSHQDLILHTIPFSEIVVVGCRSALWAQIYIHTIPSISSWQGTNIRLFQIKSNE